MTGDRDAIARAETLFFVDCSAHVFLATQRKKIPHSLLCVYGQAIEPGGFDECNVEAIDEGSLTRFIFDKEGLAVRLVGCGPPQEAAATLASATGTQELAKAHAKPDRGSATAGCQQCSLVARKDAALHAQQLAITDLGDVCMPGREKSADLAGSDAMPNLCDGAANREQNAHTNHHRPEHEANLVRTPER